MRLSLLIPCYNEAESIPGLRTALAPVIEELARRFWVELIFVDDGSTDGTWECLRACFSQGKVPGAAVRFVRHPANLGLGAALRSGFTAARGEILVTTDSDGTYPFREIPALLACLDNGAGLVTASPYHPQGGVVGVPAMRLFFSRASSLIYRALVDPRIHTYTALFRAYRREVVESVPFEADGFLAGTELLVKSLLAGYRVVEHPSVLSGRAAGISKARLLRTIWEHARFLGRVLLHRLKHTSAVMSASARHTK